MISVNISNHSDDNFSGSTVCSIHRGILELWQCFDIVTDVSNLFPTKHYHNAKASQYDGDIFT